jgi:hypothetical protein
MVLSLNPADREKIIRESEICLFCMGHAAGPECYGKGMESKLACPAPQCDKKHAKDFHDLLTKGPSKVNVLECKEDEEEEGCVRFTYCTERRKTERRKTEHRMTEYRKTQH